MEVPSTDNQIVGLFGLDVGGGEDNFILVIGHDTNNDGILEPSEVEAAIGQCGYAGGVNDSYVDANGNVNWVNMKPQDPKDPNSPIIQTTHYIYNPTTGLIKIFICDGPPGTLPSRPAPGWDATGHPQGIPPQSWGGWHNGGVKSHH